MVIDWANETKVIKWQVLNLLLISITTFDFCYLGPFQKEKVEVTHISTANIS